MKTNRITIGILAHVDAGKTTLSESILYQTGHIETLGRVDHQNAFLDTFQLEKNRGITIFSKQAMFKLNNYDIALLDTPGHVDFSAEMERVLRVLDYAILVINGSDGVQGHTLTVWKLLKQYHVPTFIFVNKMDLISANKTYLLNEIKNRIDDNCINFMQSDQEVLNDELALCDELMMEAFLDMGHIEDGLIQKAISRRHVYPIYFGSALKNEGIKEFLDGFSRFIEAKSYPDIFGARVFKVIRNEQGERLTYIKVTGGSLKVKAVLTNKNQRNIEAEEGDRQQVWSEKVDQIRIYSGVDYRLQKEVGAGSVCALTGLSMTKPGDGLGFEDQGDTPLLMPVLSYKVDFPDDSNVYNMIKNLRLLEEEEPHLNVVWNERLGEIHVQVMGEIQIEILKSTIKERFDVEVSFDKGSLVYKETIKDSVIGRGHFEPLKHYAEVHLLLEPLPLGSGIIIESACSEDVLDRNWQRLILSHLGERKHIGVLTGSVITDIKITLIAGKGHLKHTEGGDFRQATFRALRQGLMKAKSVMLEPMYAFSLEVPKEQLGKAMSDIERMKGRYDDPMIDNEMAVLKGIAPVATMMHYGTDLVTYTKGLGRLGLEIGGYEPCHNQDEIVEAIGYDPEKDAENIAGSVFCSKGSGYTVAWDIADQYMHVESHVKTSLEAVEKQQLDKSQKVAHHQRRYSDDELIQVFEQTYGKQKERHPKSGKSLLEGSRKKTVNQLENKHIKDKHSKKITSEREQFLLVDGYNMIFAWDDLKCMAEESLDMARRRLMDMFSNYRGQTDADVILVFDAYRVANNRGSSFKYHNIHVVYTKEAETADQYIESLVHKISPQCDVTVATSDVVEQVIILGKGARKLSAEHMKAELEHMHINMKASLKDPTATKKYRPLEKYLEDHLDI